jgi:hypothetical protein
MLLVGSGKARKRHTLGKYAYVSLQDARKQARIIIGQRELGDTFIGPYRKDAHTWIAYEGLWVNGQMGIHTDVTAPTAEEAVARLWLALDRPAYLPPRRGPLPAPTPPPTACAGREKPGA